MARILPFRALRYSQDLRKKASRLLAPPYDVISKEMKQQLLKSDPVNAIRLILGNPSVENHKLSDYASAAKTLKLWRENGTLERDPEPSLYAYRQTFKVEGKTYKRTGFLGLSQLEAFGRSKGGILAHEFTLAGPKADRLKLTTAAQANFSAIFSLYSDKVGVSKMLARAMTGPPDLEAKYPADVLNEVWRISDPAVLAEIQGRMEEVTLFIADGHHRYETALAYQAERRKTDLSDPGSKPYDFVMMMFVAMEDPGLVILPTHRCLAPGKIEDPVEFLKALEKVAKVVRAPGNLSNPQPMEELAKVGKKSPTIGVSFDGRKLYLVTFTKAAMASKPLAGLSQAQRGLDVTLLHRLILEPHLGITKERAEQDLVFTAKANEAIQRLRLAKSGTVFFLNPTRIGQLRDVAGAGERMPQKSTFFYPKLVTGLAFNDLSSF